MTNNHKPPHGVGEAARLFGDNDNGNVDEVNNNTTGRLIGGHGSGPTSSPQRRHMQDTTSSSQHKGEYSNPSTTPTHPITQNASNLFQNGYLRSQDQPSLITPSEKLSTESSIPQNKRDYHYALAAGIEKSSLEAQNIGLLLQQQSEQKPPPHRQQNGESSFASPFDQRPNNAPLVETNQDFCLFPSESSTHRHFYDSSFHFITSVHLNSSQNFVSLDAPPTPISIPTSPSACPLVPMFNSFGLEDADMIDSDTHFFPPLSSIQLRPMSSARTSSRDSSDDNTLPEGFDFSLF